jgi:hypothetical protein
VQAKKLVVGHLNTVFAISVLTYLTVDSSIASGTCTAVGVEHWYTRCTILTGHRVAVVDLCNAANNMQLVCNGAGRKLSLCIAIQQKYLPV